MKSEADGKLAEANALKSEADRSREQVRAESRRARELVKEAEAEREGMLSEAKQKGQEIMDHACRAAQRESTELRQQALNEIKKILSRVETVRAAADEELETQRILTDITRLRSNSASLLLQPDEANDMVQGEAGGRSSNGAAVAREASPETPQAVQPHNSAAGDSPGAERTSTSTPAKTDVRSKRKGKKASSS